MLMSKSRLEKFLYALYSLDSSDLPNPLSRIEELYSCLVTGEEAPIFEPLSRVEKYLMGILGVYDVDSLPNPLSRVEVLLYKLATGDDNLDDVKSFMSEHEELLAEIIRNGGVGGNIDIEYVLYTLSTEFNTLYNTAEKPVKSAILKGNTLVNIVKNPSEIKVIGKGGSTLAKYKVNYLDKTKNYTVLFEISDYIGSGNITVSLGTSSKGLALEVNKNGIYKFLLPSNKVGSDMNEIWLYWTNANWTDENTANVKNIIVIEGDYTNVDIPYFEGMKSVKMPVLKTTGKNLFNVETVKKGYTLLSETGLESEKSTRYISDFIYVKGLTHLAITNPERTQNIWGYDENKQPIRKIKSSGVNGNFTVSISSDIAYVRMPFAKIDQSDITDEIIRNNLIQIEEGSVATEYEPYKSNILSASEDVELRGIGEVRDTLDCLTGELTQRIGEIVLNGSENYLVHTTGDEFMRFKLVMGYSDMKRWGKSISNIFAYNRQILSSSNDLEICNGDSAREAFLFNIHKSRLSTNDVTGFKDWLSQNNTIIHYELSNNTVKTVDLLVVDQDGNNTKLSTFDDLTHVTLSSEALIPEAELEVATKNEEALNTLSLEMDDISTAQTTLEKTSNTQSENVDATMIATTEIYERLL